MKLNSKIKIKKVNIELVKVGAAAEEVDLIMDYN